MTLVPAEAELRIEAEVDPRLLRIGGWRRPGERRAHARRRSVTGLRDVRGESLDLCGVSCSLNEGIALLAFVTRAATRASRLTESERP